MPRLKAKPVRKPVVTELIWKQDKNTFEIEKKIDAQVEQAATLYKNPGAEGVKLDLTKRPATNMSWAINPLRNRLRPRGTILEVCPSTRQIRQLQLDKVINKQAADYLISQCFNPDEIEKLISYLRAKFDKFKTTRNLLYIVKLIQHNNIHKFVNPRFNIRRPIKPQCPTDNFLAEKYRPGLIHPDAYQYLRSRCFSKDVLESYWKRVNEDYESLLSLATKKPLSLFSKFRNLPGLTRNEKLVLQFNETEWKPWSATETINVVGHKTTLPKAKMDLKTPIRYPRVNQIVPRAGEYYLPVVRYTNIYYGHVSQTTDEPYIGTFYYVDPNATTLLRLGKYEIYASKYHAFIMMLRMLFKRNARVAERYTAFLLQTILTSDDAIDEIDEDETESDDDKKHYNKLKKKNYTLLEAEDFIWKKAHESLDGYLDEFGLPRILESETIAFFTALANGAEPFDSPKFQITPYLNVFIPCSKDEDNNTKVATGYHDNLDQALAYLMLRLRIDTIVLQHEQGGYRSVTEILDARVNSYGNLYLTTKIPKELLIDNQVNAWYTPAFPFCSTIWCPLNGVFTPVITPRKKPAVNRLFVGLLPEIKWKRVPLIV